MVKNSFGFFKKYYIFLKDYLCFLSCSIETKVQLKTYSQILSLFSELNKGIMKYDEHICRIKCIKYI